VNTAEERWDKLVGDFRQLCLLRRQKKWIESDIILNSDLPRSIASWSEAAADADPTAKKSRLDSMFQAEQRRIDDAFFTMDLLTTRLKEDLIPAITAQITEQVRATILEELRATIGAEVAAAARSSHQTHSAPASNMEFVEPTEAPTKENLISNFAEQVRSTVAQQAYDAVLEELGREKKPKKTYAAPTLTPKVTPKPAPVARIALDDIPGVIDFVLAEEKQSLKNPYKFELSACP
jgi:hypothetical protein